MSVNRTLAGGFFVALAFTIGYRLSDNPSLQTTVAIFVAAMLPVLVIAFLVMRTNQRIRGG